MNASILVADDSRSSRKLIVEFLLGLGYHAHGVADGWQAVRYCLETALPDMVILDAVMPEMDGFETCRKLRALPQGRQLPIIMITSSNTTTTIEDAFAAGVDEFLTKPLNWVVIRQRIRVLLERASFQLAQRSMENRLQSIFDTAVDSIVVIDARGTIHAVNQAVTRMFGYPQNELVGQSVKRGYSCGKPWEHRVASVRTSGHGQ